MLANMVSNEQRKLADSVPIVITLRDSIPVVSPRVSTLQETSRAMSLVSFLEETSSAMNSVLFLQETSRAMNSVSLLVPR